MYFLRCLYRQSEALAGRGFDITPAPVRCSGRTVGLAVFGAVALMFPVALFLSSHIPDGPVETVSALLSGSQAAVRDNLVELGLSKEIDWDTAWFPESTRMELERLGGHLHHSPWFNFSIPKGTENLRGCLAYTADLASFYVGDTRLDPADFYDSAHVFLRCQSSFLRVANIPSWNGHNPV